MLINGKVIFELTEHTETVAMQTEQSNVSWIPKLCFEYLCKAAGSVDAGFPYNSRLKENQIYNRKRMLNDRVQVGY